MIHYCPNHSLSPGDPPNRAYSHSDVSATCDPDHVSQVPSTHAQPRPGQVTRSDLGLEAGTEIRITENINTASQSAR